MAISATGWLRRRCYRMSCVDGAIPTSKAYLWFAVLNSFKEKCRRKDILSFLSANDRPTTWKSIFQLPFLRIYLTKTVRPISLCFFFFMFYFFQLRRYSKTLTVYVLKTQKYLTHLSYCRYINHVLYNTWIIFMYYVYLKTSKLFSKKNNNQI